MSIDVVDLRNFYGQRLGVVARRFIGRGIRSLWGNTASQRVLGIGYATPYLGLFREEAERCFALMPAGRGVAGARVRWPSARGRTKPARPLGANGHHALRARTSLLAQSDQPAFARDLVYSNRVERSSLCAAGRTWLVSAVGGRMGANRRDAVGAVCGRASGGSDQAGLSRDPGAAGETTTGARVGAGTGAVTRRLEIINFRGGRLTQAAAARRHRC